MWTLELTAMPIYPLRWGGSEKSHAGRDLQSRPLRFGPADDLKLEEILRTGQHAPSGEKVWCGTVFSTRPPWFAGFFSFPCWSFWDRRRRRINRQAANDRLRKLFFKLRHLPYFVLEDCVKSRSVIRRR